MRQANPILMSQLKADALAIRQLGSPILACQGMLVPRGYEHMRFLIKSCPRPIVSNEDPAEVQYGGGFTGIVAGPPKTHYTGSLQILLTEAGHGDSFAEIITGAQGGMINCDYYDGRIDSFTQSMELENCAIRFEMAEYDTDSRSQVLTMSCPIDFNFFGAYSNIGSNGTVLPGKRAIAGAAELSQRTQGVINAAQQALNAVAGVASVGRQISSLFG
ncbi:hypothetical protein [Acinetobacter chinensis]|uniref:hypothetical protein n=1 Tax=Acinetobacter chinensis TaxID=2004650 RepID=UPI00293431CC|nr:hypothetical protein [Acinetobacter chinensis]WOE40055.1 hypothetical protein QSG87_09025 [Acinetobacter chinensis]